MLSLASSVSGMFCSAVALYQDRSDEKASEQLIQHILKTTLVFAMGLSAYIVYSLPQNYYLTKGVLGAGTFLLHPGVALDIIAIPTLIYTSFQLKKIWIEYRFLMNTTTPINNQILQQLKSEGHSVTRYSMRFMSEAACKRYQEILETVVPPEDLQQLKRRTEQFMRSLCFAIPPMAASGMVIMRYLIAFGGDSQGPSRWWLDCKIEGISKRYARSLTR